MFLPGRFERSEQSGVDVSVTDTAHSYNEIRGEMFCDSSHTNCTFVGGRAHDQLKRLKLFSVRSAASVCRIKNESDEWVAHFSGR